MVLVGLVLAVLVVNPPRVRAGRRAPRRADVDVVHVAQLLALAVSSGRPLAVALRDVRTRLPESSRVCIDDVLARATRTGLARALAETTGPIGGLSARLATTQITGAPVGPALDAFVAASHDARRARAVEDARTIGVKLVVPLTLLLLPGFIALVIGPFVLEQFDGLVRQGLP